MQLVGSHLESSLLNIGTALLADANSPLALDKVATINAGNRAVTSTVLLLGPDTGFVFAVLLENKFHKSRLTY